jgi:hypothetical protein
MGASHGPLLATPPEQWDQREESSAVVLSDKGSSAPGPVGLLVPLGSGTTPGRGVGLRFKPRSTKGPIR